MAWLAIESGVVLALREAGRLARRFWFTVQTWCEQGGKVSEWKTNRNRFRYPTEQSLKHQVSSCDCDSFA